MGYEDMLEHVTGQITEDMMKFATNVVLENSKYIFVFRDGKKRNGYCTHCKNSFPVGSLKQGEDYKCPNCENYCIVKHHGRSRKYLIDDGSMVYFSKSPLDPNVIVGEGYYVKRDYRKDVFSVETKFTLKVVYIFKAETKEAIMLYKNLYAGDDSYYYSYDWGKASHIFDFDINSLSKIPYKICNKSLLESIKGTSLQYAPIEALSSISPLVVMEAYCKWPIIEQLVKAGFKDVVRQKLYGYKTFSSVNWRAKTIFKALKINKGTAKELKLVAHDGKFDFAFLKLIHMAAAENSDLTMNELLELNNLIGYTVDTFKEINELVSITKIYKYLSKQKKISKYRSGIITWRDYLNDCRKLERDITSKKVLFPKDLYAAHQNTIKQIKVKANKGFNVNIKKRVKVLSKYSFEDDKLFLRPVESSEELIKEGNKLNHCVGTYAARYAEGGTNIFVIRKKSNPKKPFYTMEINIKNTIVQVRGLDNCVPTEEVKQFIEAFKGEKLTKSKKNKRVKVPA